MSANNTGDAGPVPIRPSISDLVADYKPRLLSDEQQAVFLPQIRPLVLSVPPRSELHANALLAACSRFVADLRPPLDRLLSDLLDHFNIARWSHMARDGRVTPRSAAATVSRLKELDRARLGLACRRHGSDNDETSLPYLPEEIDQMCELMSARPDLLVHVVAGAGAGVVAHDAEAATVTSDGTALRRADGTLVQLVPSMLPWGVHAAGETVRASLWGTAQKMVRKESAMALHTYRLRQTWAFEWLNADVSALEVITTSGMTRDAIDPLLPHLDNLDPQLRNQLLRG